MNGSTIAKPLSAEKMEEARTLMSGAIDVVDNLSKYCGSIEELFGIMTLSMENEGQMRLILTSLANSKK